MGISVNSRGVLINARMRLIYFHFSANILEILSLCIRWHLHTMHYLMYWILKFVICDKDFFIYFYASKWNAGNNLWLEPKTS